MIVFIRFAVGSLVALCLLVSAVDLFAQNPANDSRQEYVRSSSPTKSGGRVISESIGGQRMVRIARTPGSAAPKNNSADRSTNNTRYKYPDRSDREQVTAYRQAANQPPQLRFPQNNRTAQCNCNGVPVPPQQLQFPPQPNPGIQAPQPQNYAATGQGGYPVQSGLGVPQFSQTGGSWWTPFVSGSGYYTPLLNFRNMPPGTYLGQGLIGQPTAFVDRQPLRNLLRYITP